MTARKIASATAFVLSAALALIALPHQAAAQSEGQLRVLKERAVEVTRMKNLFISRALDKYGIPYRLNKDGLVVKINSGGKWEDVRRIDIVPVTPEGANGATHVILFSTKAQVLSLAVSDPALMK